ncbi:MAG: hypothetical protein RL514_3500 [Verrucomicrobiota bacterium]|jgi:hypothetical protein
MNPEYMAQLEGESSGNSLLDWFKAGTDLYAKVTKPVPGGDPGKGTAPAKAPGMGGMNPWVLAGAAVAALVGLVLVLRR